MADDYLHGAYANQQQSAGSRLSSNRGRPGFSAYEIAVQHGFEGSEEDWLASLVGNGIANTELNDDYTLTLTYTDGTSDTTGSIRGEQGAPGIDAEFDGEELVITEGNDTISDGGEVSTIRVKGEARTIRDRVTEEMACSAYPTETVTGDIVSISDGAENIPVKALSVAVEPKQDLHGQDAPYPAGGSVNKLPLNAENKSYTSNGVTVTAKDGVYTLSGTATADVTIVIPLASSVDLSPSTNKVAFLNTQAVSITVGFCRGSRQIHFSTMSPINRVSEWTQTDNETIETIQIGMSSGINTNGLVVKPMLIDKSVDNPTTFIPNSNICPITGWDAVNVVRCGVNIWDESIESGAYNTTTGEKQSSSAGRMRTTGYIPVKPNTTYGCIGNIDGVLYYDKDKQFIGYTTSVATITVPSNAYYVTFYTKTNYGTTYNHDISINYPATDTAYHAYVGTSYSVSLPQTVYGGTLDVSTGVMTVDRAMVDLGSLTWVKRNTSSGHYRFTAESDIYRPTSTSAKPDVICSAYPTITPDQSWTGVMGASCNTSASQILMSDENYSDAASFKTAMSGVMLCYRLATPTTITLDPTTINTLLGNNTIYADAGQVTVCYRADVGLYIDKRIAEVQALVLDNE